MIDDKECGRRAEEAKAANEPHFYMMELGPGGWRGGGGVKGRGEGGGGIVRADGLVHCRPASTADLLQSSAGIVAPVHRSAVFDPTRLHLPACLPACFVRTGLIIDARSKGNLARLLNSSCDPNCETQKWHDAGNSEVRSWAHACVHPKDVSGQARWPGVWMQGVSDQNARKD